MIIWNNHGARWYFGNDEWQHDDSGEDWNTRKMHAGDVMVLGKANEEDGQNREYGWMPERG